MLNYNRSLYHCRRRARLPAAANQFRDAETLMYYISSYMNIYTYTHCTYMRSYIPTRYYYYAYRFGVKRMSGQKKKNNNNNK